MIVIGVAIAVWLVVLVMVALDIAKMERRPPAAADRTERHRLRERLGRSA